MKNKINTSRTQRALCSTDISMYEILPRGVIYPGNIKDVENILQLANKKSYTIHPRGAGTSVAGQSLGSGIVLDFTRNMKSILHLGENFVDVEPGVILGELNDHLKPHKLFLPVDPSSMDVCCIGGMVANNASGLHSYLYGETKDYVMSLEGFFADGSFFSTITGEGISSITKKLKKLKSKACELKNHLPKTSKNSSGYNIKDGFKDDVNLIPFLVGSEGTLCVLTKIRLKLLKIPKHRITILSLFDDFEKGLKAVKLAQKIDGLSAIELLDEELIEISREHFPELRDFFNKKTKTGILFDIDSPTRGTKNHVEEKAMELEKLLSPISLKTEIGRDKKKREKLWWMRRSASPILSRIDGSTRSLRFIEDIAVPIESIIDFYKEEKKILDRFGLKTAFFGHIGSGHFHINPRIDTRSSDFMKTVKQISEETCMLVKNLGGTFAAEHGDGILRVPYIRKFQPELYEFFVEIKNTFDPNWILNPGKIINRHNPELAFSNIRYSFRPCFELPWDIVNEVEKCHGCNDCMNFCSSFIEKGNYDEGYKSRGRANLMRSIVNGTLEKKDLSEAMHYINSCKLCGKCADVCPTGIDIIKTASLLRENGVLPLRFKKRLLMFLYFPWKISLKRKLKKTKANRSIELNSPNGLFRLGLYYIPYLHDVIKIIRDRNLKVKTDNKFLEIYLKRY